MSSNPNRGEVIIAPTDLSRGIEQSLDQETRASAGANRVYELTNNDSQFGGFAEQVATGTDYLNGQEALTLLNSETTTQFLDTAVRVLSGSDYQSQIDRYNIGIALGKEAPKGSSDLAATFGSGARVAAYMRQFEITSSADINSEMKTQAERALLVASVGDALGIDLLETDPTDPTNARGRLSMILKAYTQAKREGKINATDVQKNYVIFTLCALYTSELMRDKSILEEQVASSN